MVKEDVQKLTHGLYEIFWNESNGGGSSLAAVGIVQNGDRWMAPTNWTNRSASGVATTEKWDSVAKVVLIIGHTVIKDCISENWISVNDGLPGKDESAEYLIRCKGHYNQPAGCFVVRSIYRDPLDNGVRGMDAYLRIFFYITHYRKITS